MESVCLEILLLLLICLSIDGVGAGEYCYTHRYSFSTKYCTFGCCGQSYDRYCCSSSTGLVVGCVIGGIVLIGLIAVVCICIQKQKRRPGRVVQPTAGQPTVIMASQGAYGVYGQGQYGQVAQQGQGHFPPAYQSHGHPPPTYPPPTYPPPAYPPPPAYQGSASAAGQVAGQP